MYTRKLIDFFFPEKQQIQPITKAPTAPKAEFDWPPSAKDMEAFTVVPLRADDGPETARVSDVA